ncbi:Aim21p Ecym_4470 [Eremothecium cymbalariae DBVPG|uniref:Altered inheritance of mitochondria protein 21 n=1 Tax=Eremothecium cymbalariae (strain CBS 270.75 / DBVPG 7215 / KCTC 17166 / NRRL Y-17582) TaxID=931890 RepID=G8JU07_ERECY|nr:hypothetical protein Ecym_4470 [Eremothecium cymbalariae DBVPG\
MSDIPAIPERPKIPARPKRRPAATIQEWVSPDSSNGARGGEDVTEGYEANHVECGMGKRGNLDLDGFSRNSSDATVLHFGLKGYKQEGKKDMYMQPSYAVEEDKFQDVGRATNCANGVGNESQEDITISNISASPESGLNKSDCVETSTFEFPTPVDEEVVDGDSSSEQPLVPARPVKILDQQNDDKKGAGVVNLEGRAVLDDKEEEALDSDGSLDSGFSDSSQEKLAAQLQEALEVKSPKDDEVEFSPTKDANLEDSDSVRAKNMDSGPCLKIQSNSSTSQPESSNEASPTVASLDTGSSTAEQLKKRVPIVPKKPSSKIAAFQEMLQRQQADHYSSKPFDDQRGSTSPHKFGGTRANFKQNLNGLFALPGMAPVGASPTLTKLSSPMNSDHVQYGGESKLKSVSPERKLETPVSELRQVKARGPRGRKLPSSISNLEKAHPTTTSNSIAVFDTWSATFKSSLKATQSKEDDAYHEQEQKLQKQEDNNKNTASSHANQYQSRPQPLEKPTVHSESATSLKQDSEPELNTDLSLGSDFANSISSDS